MKYERERYQQIQDQIIEYLEANGSTRLYLIKKSLELGKHDVDYAVSNLKKKGLVVKPGRYSELHLTDGFTEDVEPAPVAHKMKISSEVTRSMVERSLKNYGPANNIELRERTGLSEGQVNQAISMLKLDGAIRREHRKADIELIPRVSMNHIINKAFGVRA